MIEMIDHERVCGHMLGLLSGYVSNDTIQEAVGYLNNLSNEQFEAVTRDLGLVFVGALRGEFSPPIKDIPTLGLKSRPARRLNRYDEPVLGNDYKLGWLNQLLDLPGGDEKVQNIFAGLSNLKSACVIKEISRSEKDKVMEAITHHTIIDPKLVSDWTSFVDEYTPYLINMLGITSERTYNTLLSTPHSPSKATAILQKNFSVTTAPRGSAEAVDPRRQLRHPVINGLFKRHPMEAICALQMGYTDLGNLKYDLPDADGTDKGIGILCPVPKVSEKLRVVLIILSVLDSLSRPTFHKTQEIISRWNTQYVMDQLGALADIQSTLRWKLNHQDYSMTSSIDQSSFTDNFSYQLIQRPILVALVRNGILTEFDLDVVDTINSGLVDASRIRKDTFVHYNTGSGMGSPPSFNLASLGNSYLVAYCYSKTYGKFHDPRRYVDNKRQYPPAYIVGDDNWISDTSLIEPYKTLCRKVGLKINPTKSFESEDTAEFCNRLITPQGIYLRRKLKPLTDMHTIVQHLEYYADNYQDYFESITQKSQVDLVPLATRLLDFPKPWGPKAFVQHKVAYENLSIEEKITVILSDISKLQKVVDWDESLTITDSHDLTSGCLPERDVFEYVKRSWKYPKVDISESKPEIVEHVKERLPQFWLSLARDALLLNKEILEASSDPEFFVEFAEPIEKIFLSINDAFPKFWETHGVVKEQLIPKVAPKGKFTLPTIVTKHVEGKKDEPSL